MSAVRSELIVQGYYV